MKKILVIAFSALLTACFSPYYPEYREVISLGATTKDVTCENTEGEFYIKIISNVAFTATLESGTDWVRFADYDATTIETRGHQQLYFEHSANNHDKRVAVLSLTSGDLRREVIIKQKGHFEDYLEIHPEDKAANFTNNYGQMPIRYEGAEVSLRLKTSCLDHEITCTVDHDTALSNVKIENSVLSFVVNENEEGAPRVISMHLSYVDGWNEVRKLDFALKQDYKMVE